MGGVRSSLRLAAGPRGSTKTSTHESESRVKMQGFRSSHYTDEKGAPAGGTTTGNGFTIAWQNGPLGRGADREEPNGAFVQDVIAAAGDRLEFYQDTQFACEENVQAIEYLKRALDVLASRTSRREAKGVEGTHDAG